MHKKIFTLVFLSVIGLISNSSLAQTSEGNVNVLEPGTLRELVNDLPAARFNILTISGSLNGKDIAYLVGGTGKMVSVDTLDISKITLVGDDEPYKQLLVETSDIGFGSTTEIYYLSERDTVIYDGHSTGLGGYVGVNHVFCKDLSGAFAENNSFKRVIMPENLKKVGNYQFFKNPTVCSVELPQKATKFGKKAFDGASALTNLRIPDGIVTIPERSVRCVSLEDVVLPPSVDTIYNQAFEGSPIRHIDLKDVRYVGTSAFRGNRFTGILNLSSLDYMGSYAFYADSNEIEGILLSPQLRKIPDYAFSGAGISSLELPSNIESVGDGAFYHCEHLTSVVLPPNLVNIYSGSFAVTPWQDNMKGDNGVIYAGSIALSYDYSTDPQNGTFSFRDGTSAIANSATKFFPTYQSDWKLEKVSLPESLIRIGDNIFSGCKDLKEIAVPDGLLEIGKYAFAGCETLQSIKIPDGVTEISDGTFSNCEGFQEFVFPNNLKRIGVGAFGNAKNMYFSELPSSLRVIESEAFGGCISIPSITLPEKVDSIYERAFNGCIGIETIRINSKDLKYAPYILGMKYYTDKVYNNTLYQVTISPEVSTLPDNMFMRCTGLQKIKFEDINSSVLNKIGENCFGECSELSISELPYSLDSIASCAFRLTKGYIGELDTKNISFIGSYAFSGTSGITDLIISTPEIFIGSGAFAQCSNLNNVKILSESIEIDGTPFVGYGIKKVEIGAKLRYLPNSLFEGIYTIDSLIFHKRDIAKKVESLEIGRRAFSRCWINGCLSLPEGTIKIGEEAFAYNNFAEIVIPNSCTDIGLYSFCNNESLSEISIGESVENIGEGAFSGCKQIKSITIPAMCKEVGTYFINGCSALQSLYFLSDTPPVFGGDLAYSARPTIFVPYNSVELYKDVPQLEGYDIEAIPFSNIPVESITLSPAYWSGIEGESFQIETTVLPENATDKTLTWSSSNESIATVNSEGYVSILQEGTCVITATANDGSGIKGECLITGTSGIEGIHSGTDRMDIFNIEGLIIKDNCTPDYISSLAPGIYLIRQGTEVKKLIIR